MLCGVVSFSGSGSSALGFLVVTATAALKSLDEMEERSTKSAASFRPIGVAVVVVVVVDSGGVVEGSAVVEGAAGVVNLIKGMVTNGSLLHGIAFT